MLSFDPKDRPPAFSLDKAHQVRGRRRGLHKREWRALLFMPLALAGVIWVWYEMVDPLRRRHFQPPEELSLPKALAPMPEPTLAGADPLPAAALIAEGATAAASLTPREVESGAVGGLDPLSLAWAAHRLAADRVLPPLPQRTTARDLILGDTRIGSPLAIAGTVIDHEEVPGGDAGPGFARAILATPEDRQFVALIIPLPSEAFLVGSPVTVLGRALGSTALPVAGTTAALRLPLVAARTVRAQAARSEADDDHLSEYRRMVPLEVPASAWEGITDLRAMLETRPFYHLIGQARADRLRPASAALPLFNTRAFDIYRDPSAWRGRQISAQATVYQTWENPEVARDQPFGAQRAYHVLAWTRDFGYWEEEDPVTGATRAAPFPKAVLRLVEFVGTGSATRPRPGQRIAMTGRFMKIRSIAVEANPLRDRLNKVQRQSDRVHMAVIVGGDYAILPDRDPMTAGEWIWTLTALAIFSGAALAIILAVRSDHRKQAAFLGKVRRIREQRLAQRGRPARPAAPPPAPDAVPASPPPTER